MFRGLTSVTLDAKGRLSLPARARDAFAKTMSDPELLAEVKKREWEANGLPAEELEALAKEVVVQPPEVVERMKKLFTN